MTGLIRLRVVALLFLIVFTYALSSHVFPALAAWQASTGIVLIVVIILTIPWTSALLATVDALRSRRSVRVRSGPLVAMVVVLLLSIFSTSSVLDARSASGDAFRGPFREPAPYIGFYARPDTRIERPRDPMSRDGATGVLTINSDGFRAPEWPAAGRRTGQDIRLAMLGGSVVFNGLTDDRTIVSLTADRLEGRAGGTEIRPMNAGIVSGNSTQELILFDTVLIDRHPDVIVVLDGFNDVWIPLLYESRPGYPYNWVIVERAWARYTGDEPVLESLLDRVSVLRRAAERLFRQWTPPNEGRPLVERGAVADEDVRQIVDLLWSNWQKIAARCVAHQVDCVLVLQPTLLYRRTPVGTEKPMLEASPLVVDAVRRFYAEFERRIATGLPGVRTASLAGLFENTETDRPVYWDPVHFYDDGNDSVATALTELICGSDLKKIRCRT